MFCSSIQMSRMMLVFSPPKPNRKLPQIPLTFPHPEIKTNKSFLSSLAGFRFAILKPESLFRSCSCEDLILVKFRPIIMHNPYPGPRFSVFNAIEVRFAIHLPYHSANTKKDGPIIQIANTPRNRFWVTELEEKYRTD